MLPKGWRSRSMLFDASIVQDGFQETHETGALFIRESQIRFGHGLIPSFHVLTIQEHFILS
jgi:hypothetical protein